MPLHNTEAFVLRTYWLAEADKICVFLTKDSGKVRGVAHGARKLRSRFGSSLEPFTEVALAFFQKEGRELVSISSCDILRTHFHRAARDFETAAAFSYMAELLIEFLPEHEPNERVYRLVSAALNAIEAGRDLWRIIRYFETWLLRLVGFFPDLSRCGACNQMLASDQPLFLTPEGAPRCMACSGGQCVTLNRGRAVEPTLRRLIADMLRTHPTDFASLHIEPGQIAQLGEINHQIIRHVLERDLRSYGLLKQLSDKG
jgi:DNA repair protein RecO (recombination protein O)